MRLTNFFLLSIISILGILRFNGCSLVGLGVGAIVDSNVESENHKISDYEFSSIEQGDTVTVVLKNGDKISGKFVTFSDMNMEDYKDIYYKSREDIFVTFPDIEDTIAINTGFSNVYSFDYIFLGFDFGSIRVRELNSEKSENYELEGVRLVVFRHKNSNRIVQKEIINNLLIAGKIPVVSNIKIRSENRVVEINSNEIINAKFTSDSDAWLTGLLIGGVIDFAIIMKLAIDGFKIGLSM